jgi:hypothetical protein
MKGNFVDTKFASLYMIVIFYLIKYLCLRFFIFKTLKNYLMSYFYIYINYITY